MANRKGDDLEDFVYRVLREALGDKWVRKTINSGATIGDNDLVVNGGDRVWQIECKQRSTKNITIRQADWNHLTDQANARLREAIMVHENERGDIIASLDFHLLVELLEGYDYG